MRNTSTRDNPALRTFIPSIEYAGRTVGGYAANGGNGDYGSLYIDEPARQAMIAEPLETNAYGKKWLMQGTTALQLNNSHLDGGNVTFADGHGSWRKAGETTVEIRTQNTLVNIRY